MRGRGYILFVLTALAALNHLDRQLMSILLEPVRHEFALSDVQLGLLSGLSFAVVYATLGVPAAVWAVRHDRRNLIAAAAALWGLTTILSGAAQSFWQILLARIGVGIGEAGGPAPSHAMVTDLYSPGERATALSILTIGVNIGVILAFLVGGLIAQRWGWRAAFITAGLVTVAFALLMRLTVRDVRPPAPAEMQSAEPVRATISRIRSDPALRQMLIGATLLTMFAYTFVAWTPSYLIRSHGLSIAAIGTYLAAAIGVGGALGNYAGGRLADLLGRRDPRWSLWLITLAFIIATPLVVAFCLVDNTAAAMILFLLPAMVSAIYIGPSIAVLHERVPVELRPVASALLLLVITLVGLGIGPVSAGALSQYVFASFGENALRYALAIMALTALWGALHYHAAGRQLGLVPRA